MPLRSHVVYLPKTEKDTNRYIVGWRLAWLYPRGTVIEHEGRRWLKTCPALAPENASYWAPMSHDRSRSL